MDRQKSITGLLVIFAFMLAEVPFSLGAWVSVGAAPEQEGVYNTGNA
jgi:small-conductance mechanosensitive channel